ncbi:MAG TPA: M1 family metallopeptidase [Bryobacteraceae bacterium]
MSSADVHSYSEPDKVRVSHCSLQLAISVAERTLDGVARLSVERADPKAPLTLDTRDLEIRSVECGGQSLDFHLGARDPILGSPLTIDLPSVADAVEIHYATRPEASGLQWLSPEQTAGKRDPFLFSQNQSIHARSWIPLQDSPGVRITYDARIQAPENLLVLMGARHKRREGTEHFFRMDLPIPPYLIALAAGNLAFAPLGARTGIYAEGPMLAAAAREFEDTERLVEAVERLYGPYRWGRYDLLVLPPSFPFGGMENPCLTFATPTVIAGDKSLVSLVSHELAHSWSGNLVTNATWRDFWLNEGLTTYLENRIQEEVYGREQALMEQVLDRREIEKDLREFAPADQILHIDLTGRDPDEGCTHVPYIKGALFLRQIEQEVGRPKFDRFLQSYFDHFAFRSITTVEALDYLRRELSPEIAIDEWVFEPGLPPATCAASPRLEIAGGAASDFGEGRLPARDLPAESWNTQEWLEFLRVLARPLETGKLEELDKAWNLTGIGNYEILDEWLLMAIESGYQPAFPRLERFLIEVGRTKLLKPLYTALMKTESGKTLARDIYARARGGYHTITRTALEKILFL